MYGVNLSELTFSDMLSIIAPLANSIFIPLIFGLMLLILADGLFNYLMKNNIINVNKHPNIYGFIYAMLYCLTAFITVMFITKLSDLTKV